MGKDLISWDLSTKKGIVWRCPIEKNHKGFMVKPHEYGLFFKSGEFAHTFSGGTHKLDKKEKLGSEIIYVTKTNLKIKWGIPQRHGIYTLDTVLGCNGDITLKIVDPLNFYQNVVIASSIAFTTGIEEDVFLAGEKKGEKKRREITEDKLRTQEITVQTAIRDQKNPYLYTHEDLQAWVIDTLKSILKDKLGAYPGYILIRGGVQRDDLIKEIRARSVEEFQEWGIEVVTFNISGWNPPAEYEAEIKKKSLTELKFEPKTPAIPKEPEPIKVESHLPKDSTLIQKLEGIEIARKTKEMLENAQHSIYMMQYEIFDVRTVFSPKGTIELNLSDLLIKKALNGVNILLMMRDPSDLGSLARRQQAFIDAVKMVPNINVKLCKNIHQKIVIVDEREGWDGSANFTPTGLSGRNDSVNYTATPEILSQFMKILKHRLEKTADVCKNCQNIICD
ncbi:MAG: phospholipase D-like domain-containing protein [Candidatus Helarchaeota archaeon]